MTVIYMFIPTRGGNERQWDTCSSLAPGGRGHTVGVEAKTKTNAIVIISIIGRSGLIGLLARLHQGCGLRSLEIRHQVARSHSLHSPSDGSKNGRRTRAPKYIIYAINNGPFHD